MTASVPEFTARTMSMPGTREQRRSAKSTSAGVAMPNVLPCAAAFFTAATTSLRACPRIIAPQLQQ